MENDSRLELELCMELDMPRPSMFISVDFAALVKEKMYNGVLFYHTIKEQSE